MHFFIDYHSLAYFFKDPFKSRHFRWTFLFIHNIWCLYLPNTMQLRNFSIKTSIICLLSISTSLNTSKHIQNHANLMSSLVTAFSSSSLSLPVHVSMLLNKYVWLNYFKTYLRLHRMLLEYVDSNLWINKTEKMKSKKVNLFVCWENYWLPNRLTIYQIWFWFIC